MISCDKIKLECNSFCNTVILYGKFSDLTAAEYRYLTINPHYLTKYLNININFDQYYYKGQIEVVETVGFWIFKKKKTRYSDVYINSFNTSYTYLQVTPEYDINIKGLFVIELIVNRHEYKRLKMIEELKELLSL